MGRKVLVWDDGYEPQERELIADLGPEYAFRYICKQVHNPGHTTSFMNMRDLEGGKDYDYKFAVAPNGHTDQNGLHIINQSSCGFVVWVKEQG